MSDTLLDLIRRARQRVIGNLVLEQASLGLTLGLACGVLLLLLGTQILDWYWPLLLFAAAFGFGLWRFWSKLPADYRIAQMLDQRLALPDTLSTAFYFSQPAAKAPSEDLRAMQRAEANEAAQAADVALALPWRWTRFSTAAASLAFVFTSLMAYRYGTQSRLDLSQPLVPALVDLFGTADTSSPLAQLQKKNQQGPQPDPINGNSQTEEERKEEEPNPALDEAPDDVLKTIGVPEVDNSAAEESKKGDMSKDGQPEGDDKGESGDAEGGNDPGNKAQPDKNSKDPADTPNNKQQQSGDKNSLAEKFRDALANLMNKVKQPGKANDQMAKNEAPKDGQGQGQGEKKDGQKGQQSEGKPNAQGSDGEQKSDSDAKAGDQDQSADGKGATESNQPKGNDDPKSGTGKQDGNKDSKLAMHNTEALGKLSEIIGKRSEKQTGEVMVEVSSGKNQQLRTAYSSKTGQHADSGGEIHRDEVPLMYQQYVQSYFDQLRKAPAPAAPSAPKK